MFLRQFPPMGVYEILFEFASATSRYMGDEGTHPWAQGYPLTQALPGGPPPIEHVSFGPTDLKYPQAAGNAELREAITRYYNDHYDAGISVDNVAVFAGGRPAILAILLFLQSDVSVAIEETEYTPYYDMLELLARKHQLIPSHPENRFRPDCDQELTPSEGTDRLFLVKSNPCNPTGVTLAGDELGKVVDHWSQPGRGALFDEAYEFFCDPEPESVLRYVKNIDETDVFVVGAATKGLQAPGARVGWVVASRDHVELLRNYSSIGMGGVSRLSQIYVTQLLEPTRVRQAKQAVQAYFSEQRKRYAEGLAGLGFELFTGEGGFYHWGRLPGELTASEFNQRLYKHEAGILPGRLCDMARREGAACPLDRFVRFSFGPLEAGSYENDLEILRKCL